MGRLFSPFKLSSLFYRLLIVLLSLSLYFEWGWSQSRYEGETIVEIAVEGEVEINEEQIKSFLPFVEGDVLNLKLVRKGLQNLFEANFIKDVKFDVKQVNDGVVIHLLIESHLKIENIYTVGNEVFNDFSILEEVNPEKKRYFIRSEMNSIKFLIINKYHEKGYLDVEVDYEARPSKENPDQLEVVFLIREGSAYLVKEILFKGNGQVDPEDIIDSLTTKVDTFFTEGIFNPSVFESDKSRILYFLRTQGYFKARILGVQFEYEWKETKNKKKKYVVIKVELELGELYYFGDLTLKGNSLFSRQELEIDFKREKGKLFDQSIHDQDIASIYQKYQQNGYIFARITPIETITTGNKIDYVLDVYEGTKARIEKIFIKGLKKTREQVVLRELQFREGEIFDVDRIRLSMLRLNRLEYFSKIEPDYRTGSAEGLMNLNVLLKEKPTGTLSGGFTYAVSSGISLVADYSDRNFLGFGYSFSTKLQLGFTTKDVSISFTDPWFLGAPVSLGGAITLGKYYVDYQKDLNVTNIDGKTRGIISPDGSKDRGWLNNSDNSIQYTRDKISLSIFSGQRFGDWYEVYQSFGVEFIQNYLYKKTIWPEKYSQYSLYEKNKDLFSIPPPIDDPWKKTFFLVLGLSRDARNSIFNPTQGSFSSLRAKVYFGDYQFVDWSFDNAFFTTLAWRVNQLESMLWQLTAVYKMSFRTLGSFTPRFEVDSYYQIRENQLRGWNYDMIHAFRMLKFGQEGLIDDKAYFQSYILHSFELRQTMFTDLVQLIYFLDFAGVNNDKFSLGHTSSWSTLFRFSDFMNSTGFGLRINFPQLPIRFYWAWRFYYDSIKQEFSLFRQEDKIPIFVFDVQGKF